MSLIVAAALDLGRSKSGRPLSGAGAVEAYLTEEDGTTVAAGPYNPDREVGTSGIYEFDAVTIPDGWLRGHWRGDAGDGSSEVSVPVNLVDLGLIMSGVGERRVTLTIRNADTLAAVVGASVSIRSGSTLVRWASSQAGTGQAIFGLAPGDYTADVTAGPGYAPLTSYAFTVVAGSDLSANVDIEPQAASPPSAAGLCTVYGYYQRNGVAVQDTLIRAKLEGEIAYTDDVLADLEWDERTVDAAGYWELELWRKDQFVKGGKYRFEVWPPDATRPAIVRTGFVPNADEAEFDEVFK